MVQLTTCSRCQKRYASVIYKGKKHDEPVCLFCYTLECDLTNLDKLRPYQGIQRKHLVLEESTNEFYFVLKIEKRNYQIHKAI